ncbi:unnamed protein product [Discosporangium mesarthrocarpum]
MNFFFPLFYSVSLFCILIIISYYIFQQIINVQKLENRIFILREKIQNNRATYQDFYILGQIYLKKKIFNKSILLFRQALQIWDFNDQIGLSSLYNTLGFTYFNLKNYNFAIYYYNISIQLVPDSLLALTNLGFTYEKINLYEKAYEYYQNTLKFDVMNKLALSRISVVEKKLKFKS